MFALPPEADVPPGWDWNAPDSFWLKEYMAFARTVAPMSDKYFHLAVGLFILSTAVARRVCLPIATQSIYPNLYQIIIAPSTLHHKTTALQFGLDLIRAAHLDLLLLPQRHTPQSLLAELSPSSRPPYSAWSYLERQRWLAERPYAAQRGWLLDEASPLFDSLPGFLPLILSLYDCPDRQVVQTIGRGRQTVDHPYLSFLAAATPAAVAPHLANPANWTNGFWARFAFVIPRQAEPAWQFFPPLLPTPQPLIDHLNHLAFTALTPPPDATTVAPTVALRTRLLSRLRVPPPLPTPPLPATLAPHVQTAWEAYAKATSHDFILRGGLDQRLWASYGRLHIIAIKIALLLATSDWSAVPAPSRPPAPTVQLAHWYRAQSLAEVWRANLHLLLEDNPTPTRREENLLSLLTRAGERGLTLRELRQYSHLDHDEVSRQVNRLIKECVVEKYAAPSGKTSYYHLIQPTP